MPTCVCQPAGSELTEMFFRRHNFNSVLLVPSRPSARTMRTSPLSALLPSSWSPGFLSLFQELSHTHSTPYNMQRRPSHIPARNVLSMTTIIDQHRTLQRAMAVVLSHSTEA